MKKRIFFSLVLLLFSACKEDKVTPPIEQIEYLQVTMQPTFGSDDLILDETYTTAEGYDVQFTDLKCYFTRSANGSKTLCDAALFDFRENGTFVFKKEGNKNDFSDLSGYLGVDVLYNHSDPSAFANDNPLNIAIANDMHWDWNPGYIFMKVEAKVDTLNDGIANFNHFVVFHIGGDNLIQPLSFTNINWISVAPDKHVFPLKLDMQKFLQNNGQTIDLKTEHISHSASGQETLSQKVIENFKSAISSY